ncbi:ribosomal RNA-processing protein 7-domain-containing protein [Phaeosphaeria sp. MPI-PUGE-AT-0046c]|nr:ribosomal RNA-processing protein 7-domain-containing protein [Phaeosphaeria sp. MPI-PUGE-AT-0046c]
MAPEMPTKPKTAKSAPKTVADFTILSLTLPTISGLPEQCQNAKHYIYVKPHAPSIPSASDERSLFVANIPIDATENNVRALFVDQLGGCMVERVEFDSPIPAHPLHKRWKADKHEKQDGESRGKKRKRNEEALVAEGVVEDEDSALPSIWPGELRRSGSGAVVIFVDKKSARGAMKEIFRAVKENKAIHWRSGDAPLGAERYRKHNELTYPTPTSLQASLNAYLTQFNALEVLRNKHRKTARSVPDEEGFVTVTRGGRAGPARVEEAERKKEELEARKKKNAVKDDFYRFQNREKRKEQEMGLRRRFEEDQKRVERMREGRGKVRPEA